MIIFNSFLLSKVALLLFNDTKLLRIFQKVLKSTDRSLSFIKRLCTITALHSWVFSLYISEFVVENFFA